MTPLVEFDRVSKGYGSDVPFRILSLTISAGDRLALEGLDEGAAETLVHLVTGAALPDAGVVRVGGRDTRDIATDSEWLQSLDRLGLVSHRALLIDALPVAANLALPLTLAVEPMSDETRHEVERLAAEVGLPLARLEAPTATLTDAERVRVHLARAIALGPDFVVVEHPMGSLDDRARDDLGTTIGAIAARRHLAVLLTRGDSILARAAAAKKMRLDRATGQLLREGLLRRWLGR